MSGRKFIYTKDKLNYIREKIKLYKEKIYLRPYENMWASCRDVACNVSTTTKKQKRQQNGFLPAVGMTMSVCRWVGFGGFAAETTSSLATAGHSEGEKRLRNLKEITEQVRNDMGTNAGDMNQIQNRLPAKAGGMNQMQNRLPANAGGMNQMQNRLSAKAGDMNQMQNRLSAKAGGMNRMQNRLPAKAGSMNHIVSRVFTFVEGMNYRQSLILKHCNLKTKNLVT